MQNIIWRSTGVAIGLAATLALSACDVDQTQEGELPQVDVDVEGGQLPRYDVNAPEIEIATRDEQVTIPDVDIDVDREERTITLPDVNIDIPDEEDNENAAAQSEGRE
jgi:hypothetical protein